MEEQTHVTIDFTFILQMMLGPTEASIQLNPRAVFRDLTSNYASGNGGHFKIKAFAKTKAIMGRKVEEGYDPSETVLVEDF